MNGVIEGTEILTPNGPVYVESIVPGDYILSAFVGSELAAVPVNNIIVNDYTGPVRTFCTDRNQCLSVTLDHVLFADIAEGAPADVWEQIGREVLPEEKIKERVEASRSPRILWDPPPKPWTFGRAFRTKKRPGTVWLEIWHSGVKDEAPTPEGYITNPPVYFESHQTTPIGRPEFITNLRSVERDFDTVWEITRKAQQQQNLEGIRLELHLGDWVDPEDPVTIYNSLPANLLTPWHFVPTADDRQHDDGLFHIRSARVCDILDDDYTGRVYDLSVNPLCNYLAAGIVVFSAREQE